MEESFMIVLLLFTIIETVLDFSDENENKLLSFLSFPQKIKVKHMFMKNDEFQLFPRECRIWKQDENRFKIEYLE